MKRFFLLALLMLATFASAQQADSTDILITVREDGDTLQTGRWRSGMAVRIRDSWNGWGERERLANKFVIVRVGVEKSRIDSFLVAHSDSTTGLRRKYQLSRSAIQIIKNRRDENNVARINPGQLRQFFKRANRLRQLGNPQRMGVLTPDLFIRWRNMLVTATQTSATVITTGGGDYTSLVAAEAGEQKDLVSANEQITFNCSGTTAEVSGVVFSGWTVDATRLPIIQGDNTTGIIDDTKYRFQMTVSANAVISSEIAYAEFRNIYGVITGTGAYAEFIRAHTNSVLTVIKNCNVEYTASTSTSLPIGFSANYGEVMAINCIATGKSTTGWGFNCGLNAAPVFNVFNSIATKFNRGFIRQSGSGSPGTMTVKNSIAQNNTDGFNGTIGGDYNISDLPADAPGEHSLNETSVNFVDASGGDFSLVAESAGIDQGVDLSAEGVTTDIKGVARPQGDAFDIGVFEFPVANDTNTDTKKQKWLEWIKRKKN